MKTTLREFLFFPSLWLDPVQELVVSGHSSLLKGVSYVLNEGFTVVVVIWR